MNAEEAPGTEPLITPPAMEIGERSPPPLRIVIAVDVETRKEEKVEAMMAKLQHFQEDAQCQIDVAEFLLSYIQHCVDREARNAPLVKFKDYQYRRLVCHFCFHSKPSHVPQLCETKCCNQRRCSKCMHPHPKGACTCTHTENFLQWMRKNMKTN